MLIAKKSIFLISLPAVIGLSLIGASDASAKIRLKGCIKWWHPAVASMDPSKAWWPLKKTEVDIEWDGAGKDKSQFTGKKGNEEFNYSEQSRQKRIVFS
mgnify:CR=1 FL=1